MILIITNTRLTGLNYHRQLVPFKNLGIPVEFRDSEFGMSDAYLTQFKCISFLRKIESDPARYKRLGLKIHFDIDDYWVLPSGHHLCKEYKSKRISETTIQNIKDADFVTTTTRYLAERIRKINKNVYVLPNAIDSAEEQWQIGTEEKEFDRLRIGYIAGVHHERDVEMLYPELMKIWKDKTIQDKWQLSVGGFNFNKIDENTIKANPYYRWVEQCFTHNYSKVKSGYAQLLATDQPLQFKQLNEPYRRINGSFDVYQYAKQYDEIDISIAPLISSEFNRNKSQLKMIEAGMKCKPCIVSNVIPYTLEDAPVIYCNDNEWHKKIKYCVNNPEFVKDKGAELNEYCKANYEIGVVNVERKQILKKWLE